MESGALKEKKKPYSYEDHLRTSVIFATCNAKDSVEAAHRFMERFGGTRQPGYDDLQTLMNAASQCDQASRELNQLVGMIRERALAQLLPRDSK